ncbi:MAG: hypothetical protein HUU20_00445 [Pirellulales bacterium]|nr:hypothetical protein [Pirellulales bacterium]
MKRSMIILVVLLSSASTAAAADQILAAEKRTPDGSTISLEFQLDEVPHGRQVRLGLDARIDWPGLGGSNPWMIVAVNGHPLKAPDLVNKPVEFTMLCGMDTTWVHGESWRIVYSPDFSDAIRTERFSTAIPDVDPYRFVWDATPYVRPGKNAVQITHLKVLPQGSTLVLRDVRVEIGAPIRRTEESNVRPAPAGPLPTYVVSGRRKAAMNVELAAGGGIRIEAGGRALVLSSRTSQPQGQWITTGEDSWKSIAQGQSGEARWNGAGYEVARRVSVRDDHVHVADTFTCTGNELAGVIYENRLAIGPKPREIMACGQPAWFETGQVSSPAHPTITARWEDFTVGLAAEDDIFRMHCDSFAEPDAIGLRDAQLGIAPGKSHTLEWSIYPVPKGDYWDFINALRRNWGSIFTLPWAIVFESAVDGTKTAEEYGRWATSRGMKAICSGQTYFMEDGVLPKGMLGEGTAIPMAETWCSAHADWIRKLRAAAPGVKVLIYIHAQICTEPGAETLYADSKLLDAAGGHVPTPYHYPIYMYLSTLENSYGKALFKALEKTLQITGADGFYCDEMAAAPPGTYAYHTAWDGCTVSIDPRTHAVTGKRAMTTLLQQPWKVALVKHLREQGKTIIGNSPAHTRTMLQLHIPRFTELASFSFAVNTQLGSPWALGNYSPEMSGEVCAHMVRRLLDKAAVFTTYTWPDGVEGPWYQALMYPITPVELREGMVIGNERILTNRSGRYGWPDGAGAEIYVIDRKGNRVEKPLVAQVREDGRLLTEIRMSSDHFAILVRKD